MVHLDNPARLLHSFLTEGKGQPGTSSSQDTLYRLLKAHTDDGRPDPPLFYRRLAHLFELPGAAEAAARALPDLDEESDLSWAGQVHPAFASLGMQNAWDNFIGKINEVSLFSLNHCARHLEKAKYGALKQSDIDSIRTDVEDLLAEVNRSDLDAQLKGFIRDHLDRIREALNGLPIVGAEPLKHAVEVTIGAVIIERPEIHRSDLGKKFLRALATIATLLKLADGIVNFTGIEDHSRPGIEVRIEPSGPPRLAIPAPEERPSNAERPRDTKQRPTDIEPA